MFVQVALNPFAQQSLMSVADVASALDAACNWSRIIVTQDSLQRDLFALLDNICKAAARCAWHSTPGSWLLLPSIGLLVVSHARCAKCMYGALSWQWSASTT
jgi:hypothetical protein